MYEEPDEIDDSQTPLGIWIERILFIMNLLIGAMGSVLILRFQRIALATFEDFAVELSKLTEFALSPVYNFLIPALTAVAFACHFLSMKPKIKMAIQAAVFLAMLTIAGLFVVMTVPVMYRLIESLS